MMKRIISFAQSLRILWRPPSLLGWFFLSMVLWVYLFRGFLSGQWLLSWDALAYYEHFKFYMDNLARGVYPLWDPYGLCGIPNEFFLRRIGSFNPLFSVLFLLKILKVPYTQAYLVFLAFYYWVGLLGFYFLAKHFFRDKRMAFVAYLLLMFSALGTRLFDSYIVLAFIPMVWFFYFLVAFTERQEKHFFLGIVLALMLIVTTYIPFYFVTIFLAFLFCFCVIYFKSLKSILRRYGQFARGHKILVCLCLLALVLSLWPGYQFYREGKTGQVVLPFRHTNSPVVNELVVHINTITQWAILEDLVFSAFYSDLREFRFALVYVPVFAYILLFLGIIINLNKRLFFLALWGGIVFFLGTPRVTPIYQFLYDHVFFFKYFRNLHFFFWFLLLPLFILFVVEQFRVFLSFVPRTRKERLALWAYIVVVHVAFAFLICRRADVLTSSSLSVALSFIFFFYCFLYPKKRERWPLMLLLFIAIAYQPIEVYQYLPRTATLYTVPYRYEKPYLFFDFIDKDIKKKDLAKGSKAIAIVKQKAPEQYFTTRWYDFLYHTIDREILHQYIRHKFVVYDRIQWHPPVSGQEMDALEEFGEVSLKDQNVALVSSDKPPEDFVGDNRTPAPSPRRIEGNGEDFRVLKYDVNSIKLRTNFPAPKFLVYNDTFHDQWQVWINGKRARLYRANLAFKGVWLPAGENVVVFRFGSLGLYAVNWLLLGIFYSLFLAILITGRKKGWGPG